MSAALQSPPDGGSDLVGSVHRIGEIGPPYKVLSVAEPGQVRIMLLESGEVLDYPASAAREDPAA